MPSPSIEPLFPPVKKPVSNALETLSVRVHPSVADDVRDLAARYDRSQGEVISELVSREIARTRGK